MRSGDVKSKTKSMKWTKQGADGLVMTTIHTGTNAGTYFLAYDGNGNVSAEESLACRNSKINPIQAIISIRFRKTNMTVSTICNPEP